MIAKLEWTQSNPQQNIEQLQNPTMGVTSDNESTTIFFFTCIGPDGKKISVKVFIFPYPSILQYILREKV